MKIIVSKSAIDGAVKNLSKVINKRNALPILGDILCEVKDQKMVMTGSDSEVIIITSIPLDMQDGEGKFCVGAKHLKDALSQLQEQPVTISVNTDSDMRLTIHHQTGEIFFPADSPDEYPQLGTWAVSCCRQVYGRPIPTRKRPSAVVANSTFLNTNFTNWTNL